MRSSSSHNASIIIVANIAIITINSIDAKKLIASRSYRCKSTLTTQVWEFNSKIARITFRIISQTILIKSQKCFKLYYVLLKSNVINNASTHKRCVIKTKKLFKIIFFYILKNFLIRLKFVTWKSNLSLIMRSNNFIKKLRSSLFT